MVSHRVSVASSQVEIPTARRIESTILAMKESSARLEKGHKAPEKSRLRLLCRKQSARGPLTLALTKIRTKLIVGQEGNRL